MCCCVCRSYKASLQYDGPAGNARFVKLLNHRLQVKIVLGDDQDLELPICQSMKSVLVFEMFNTSLH